MLSVEKLKRIEPEYKKVLRITIVIWALLVCAVGTFLTWRNEWSFTSLGVLAAVALFFLLMFLFYPRKIYENTFYGLVNEVFYVQKGLWFKKRTAVAQNRIQHTDVAQGPLMRRYDLASLIIHTAGIKEADINISGLKHADATAMRNYLLELNKKLSQKNNGGAKEKADSTSIPPNVDLRPDGSSMATTVLALNTDTFSEEE